MTRPMEWLAAIRDHPRRPPAQQSHVLTMLALRMDWATGTGFASTGQLAADAECGERTVKRATKWGRDRDMLILARRGHRLGNGTTRASEWELAIPQGATGDTLSGTSTGTGLPVEQNLKGPLSYPMSTPHNGTRPNLKGPIATSQGDSPAPPSRPVPTRPVKPRRRAKSQGASPATQPGPHDHVNGTSRGQPNIHPFGDNYAGHGQPEPGQQEQRVTTVPYGGVLQRLREDSDREMTEAIRLVQDMLGGVVIATEHTAPDRTGTTGRAVSA